MGVAKNLLTRFSLIATSGQLLWALFTTRWPAMRGHSMALSGLSVALLLAVLTTVHSQDMMSGTMQCQCSCASDCTSGDSVTCDCPEPAYACAPGFTQVCPLDAGACPAGMSPKCPGGGAPPTTTTTTTTTPAPPALVTKVVPSCSPKKSKCTKGVNVNF